MEALLPLLMLCSPIAMVGVEVAAFAAANRKGRLHTGAAWLVFLSAIYGVLAAALSLAWTIHWMGRYESETGYDAGNGPLGWIFIFGPLSVAFGQALGLIQWWHTKPTAQNSSNKNVA